MTTFGANTYRLFVRLLGSGEAEVHDPVRPFRMRPTSTSS